MGDAATHAWGLALSDSGIAVSSAISAQLVWVDASFRETAAVSVYDAGRLLIAGGISSDCDAGYALNDAEAAAASGSFLRPAAGHNIDSDRDAVRTRVGEIRRLQLCDFFQTPAWFLSAVHGLGGGTSETEAGSAAAGALTATDAGLQPAILRDTENQGLDSTTRAGSFQRIHQAKATGGAMSSLPAAVSQPPAGSRTLAPDVEAADFRGGQEGASTRVLGRDTPLGDLRASGRDLAGGLHGCRIQSCFCRAVTARASRPGRTGCRRTRECWKQQQWNTIRANCRGLAAFDEWGRNGQSSRTVHVDARST